MCTSFIAHAANVGRPIVWKATPGVATYSNSPDRCHCADETLPAIQRTAGQGLQPDTEDLQTRCRRPEVQEMSSTSFQLLLLSSAVCSPRASARTAYPGSRLFIVEPQRAAREMGCGASTSAPRNGAAPAKGAKAARRQRLQEVFALMDRNKDGSIDVDELLASAGVGEDAAQVRRTRTRCARDSAMRTRFRLAEPPCACHAHCTAVARASSRSCPAPSQLPASDLASDLLRGARRALSFSLLVSRRRSCA